jgi:crossover junction endodeoxyribonuclease RuvC
MKIGIDPGISGALALLTDKNEVVDVQDMPVMALNDKKQQVNAVGVALILERWQGSETPLVAYIEKVSARPGQGVTAMFNFGMGYGIVQGVLACKRIPFYLVTPQLWKKRAGLIHSEKDKARTVAQQIFPKLDLTRKKDIGRADALLIAMYGETLR